MSEWTLEHMREGDYLGKPQEQYCTTWATIRYGNGSFSEGGIFTVSIRHAANTEGRKQAIQMIDRILKRTGDPK